MSLVPGAGVLDAAMRVSIVFSNSLTGFAVESEKNRFPISRVEGRSDGFTYITYHVGGKELTSTITQKESA